jgi:hypothetical protein
MTERSESAEASAAEPVAHWRRLRQSLDSEIRRLETELRAFRFEFAGSVAGDPAERGYERLLRLRRVNAKVASRDRFAARAVFRSAQRVDRRQA